MGRYQIFDVPVTTDPKGEEFFREFLIPQKPRVVWFLDFVQTTPREDSRRETYHYYLRNILITREVQNAGTCLFLRSLAFLEKIQNLLPQIR